MSDFCGHCVVVLLLTGTGVHNRRPPVLFPTLGTVKRITNFFFFLQYSFTVVFFLPASFEVNENFHFSLIFFFFSADFTGAIDRRCLRAPGGCILPEERGGGHANSGAHRGAAGVRVFFFFNHVPVVAQSIPPIENKYPPTTCFGRGEEMCVVIFL